MTDPTRPDRAGRLRKLQDSLVPQALDALVVSTPNNVRYLTGFAGTAGLLLAAPQQLALVVDGRYSYAARETLAREAVLDATIEKVDRRYDLTLGEVIQRMGLRRVAFESAHVTVSNLLAWQRATPGVEWIPREGMVEAQRLIKDAGEIEIFRRGGRAIAKVAAELRALVGHRRTEQEIASAIDASIARAGFSGPSFSTIVASGPNSAHPHARPSPRRLAPGDLVVLDFGGVLDGYCVDLTRMAAVGPVAPQANALFAGVRDANAAAVAAVQPGIDSSAIDEAARRVLEARGLEEAILHATGHGLGLDIHEAPRIARADPDTTTRLQAGMVFTVEPGAYVEGIGGVRLEDDVLVTAVGGEVLTDVPRDLLVV
jgi:Xaa-Pro aminopeptidase